MALTCGNQIGEIFVEVLNVPIHLVTDVGISLGSWCIVNVASIWQNCWVTSGDNAVGKLGDFLLDCIRGVRRRQQLLHIWCIRQPCQTMHMRTATVLPLKSHPVVSDTEYSHIVILDELLHSVIEKPVSNSWVLNDGFGTT